MNPIKKFPFKHMLDMVQVIAGKPEGALIPEIASSSKSCFPDTREVTNMASFITGYGKIERNGGWTRIINGHVAPSGPQGFRTKFLQDIMSIINILDENGKTVDAISMEMGIDKGLVKQYLEFLEALTGFGRIVMKGEKWHVKPWTSHYA